MTAFWTLYDRQARPVIERACRAASRSLAEGTMDPDEMASWVHQRVWRMAEASAAPTFHDDPTPEEAVERLVRHARVLARWAYLSLMRAHWRRTARQNAHKTEITRTERLAMVSRVETDLEHDEHIQSQLESVRTRVSQSLRAKLAASWADASERRRIALALGATDAGDDELIDRTTGGEMKENTVQQMRSRAQRQIRAIFGAARHIAILAIAATIVSASAPAKAVSPAPEASIGTIAGEQTGGRSGKIGLNIAARGEQSGGRKK
ncbi:MAG: hypothetical protein KF866_02530 [Phycisphaeraceae bacterium]|nr:hypothetical protein [Phycisphaeraceae bacterium]